MTINDIDGVNPEIKTFFLESNIRIFIPSPETIYLIHGLHGDELAMITLNKENGMEFVVLEVPEESQSSINHKEDLSSFLKVHGTEVVRIAKILYPKN